MIRLYAALALASVLAAGASYGLGRWQGYRNGHNAAQAQAEAARQKLQAELFRVGDELSRKAAELDAARADRKKLIEVLEDEARKDPAAPSRAISADSLRRLKLRWRSR